ncbi:hypothetical protein [Guptibacillus hwajinpoensis]|uniref:hypothetical protein n=1 Tax=Guptibacillus hwajinpoensis TaxID=208199 RepID=UPI003736F553
MLDLAAVFHLALDWMVENKGYRLQSAFLFGGLSLSFVTYFFWYVTKGFKIASE